MQDLSQFQFSIIYSVDLPKDTYLHRYFPPNFKRNRWIMTESGPSEYDFTPKWRHRKYCGLLNFQQFCEFLEHVGIYPERVQTMGSIGSPGFGIGWSPAVAFNGSDSDVDQSAYVTPVPPEPPVNHTPPLPGFEDLKGASFPIWEDVEKDMWEWFENGATSAIEFAKEMKKEKENAENLQYI